MSTRDSGARTMPQKKLVFKCVVVAILVAILAGIVYLLLRPGTSCASDSAVSENGISSGSHDSVSIVELREILRHLIVLAQPGPRSALVRLPGLDLEAGVLLTDAKSSLKNAGEDLKEKYEDFLSQSTATWLTPPDPWIYESSEELMSGMGLNSTVPVMFPLLFGRGVEDLYVRMIPQLSALKDQLPQCLLDLAEAEVPEAPEDVVTFWGFLMGEGIDNLNASTLSSLNLTFEEGCLTRGKAVISDEMFLNVTRSIADLLAPMLSNVMMEVLSQEKPTEALDDYSSSVSVYGTSEWHLQLLLLCLQENAWTGRPGHHAVVELYDSKVNVVYGKKSKSMPTLDFVRSIALCGAFAAANQ